VEIVFIWNRNVCIVIIIPSNITNVKPIRLSIPKAYDEKQYKQYKYNGSYENFPDECFKEVIRCIRKYPEKYPDLFWWKFSTTWGRYGRYPESGYIEWSFYPTAVLYQNESGEHPITKAYYEDISTLLGQYYFILMLLAFLGIMGMLRKKINYTCFFLILTIFGFILMTFLSEAQMRYRSIFFPYLSMLAAFGLNFLLKSKYCMQVLSKNKEECNVMNK